MDEKQVSKSVFKKLSALRATLTDEEQMLLDTMLVGDYDVSAHRMNQVKTSAKTSDLDEVAAHSLTSAKTTAKTAAVYSNIDEVAAHSLTSAKTAAKTTAQTSDIDEVAAHVVYQGVTSRGSMRVIFDEEQEIYVIE